MFLILSSMGCGDFSYSLYPASQNLIPEELFYQTDGNCERGDLHFRILSTAGIQLWTDPQNILTGQVELFIFRDSTFSARYREFPFSGNAVFEKVISGNYQIQSNGEIYFQDLGAGNILHQDGLYFLEFRFDVNINSTELAGKTARFRVLKGLRGLDTDRAQYCHY